MSCVKQEMKIKSATRGSSKNSALDHPRYLSRFQINWSTDVFILESVKLFLTKRGNTHASVVDHAPNTLDVQRIVAPLVSIPDSC